MFCGQNVMVVHVSKFSCKLDNRFMTLILVVLAHNI